MKEETIKELSIIINVMLLLLIIMLIVRLIIINETTYQFCYTSNDIEVCSYQEIKDYLHKNSPKNN